MNGSESTLTGSITEDFANYSDRISSIAEPTLSHKGQYRESISVSEDIRVRKRVPPRISLSVDYNVVNVAVASHAQDKGETTEQIGRDQRETQHQVKLEKVTERLNIIVGSLLCL